MKPNHYARKKRQLKVLVEKLKYFMDPQYEDSLDQFKKLVQELALVISKPALIKILGTAAIFIGISFTNQLMAQSFGPPQTNPFGLVSTISGSHPALADLDGDGDVDLLVGENLGHIEYFENIGTATNPQFDAPQMNPFGLDSSYLYSPGNFSYFSPSFADLDDDGDMDLLIGGQSSDGQMLYFENMGDLLNPQFDVPQTNPFGLVWVGWTVDPEFADMDGDGDSDLLVGTGVVWGGLDLMYFENTGSSANPQFSAPQQNPFGLVPNFYSSGPSFADLDEDGDMDLLVGGDYYFNYFENIGDPFNPQFDVPQPNPFGLPGLGGGADPAFADLDGDEDSDLLVGTWELPFDIVYFENTTGDGECPPGMIFTYQAQIDSLHANHPNCTEIKGDVVINGSNITNLNGLNVITAIWGNFTIGNNTGGGNSALTNLAGLQNLDSIGGNLEIYGNSALTSLSGLANEISIGGDMIIANNGGMANLSGLENLISITGGLKIQDSPSLIDLTGLDNLASIGGGLTVQANDLLSSLNGLNSLTTIGGNFILKSNIWLSNITGLESLTTISGNLVIGGNNWASGNMELISLNGLESLTSIDGSIEIMHNPSLSSINGLENLNANSISPIIIINNYVLTNCEALGICDFLSNPNGTIEIYGNAQGCNNPWEIANACGFLLPCLQYGSYLFSRQTDVDNFGNFTDCTELEVGVIIRGMEINNLNGLSGVTSISGDLEIYENYSLPSLTGLDNLSFIGQSLLIHDNTDLTNLSGLTNLNFIGEHLSIYNNNFLSSLSGLNGPASIGGNLYIGGNNVLSVCDVQSICDYLASPNGTVSISNNAPGCNSEVEVQTECEGECPPGMIFTYQAQIDSLHANHPNCTEIKGDVVINGSDITNLNGFNVITAVWGDFNIGSTIGGCNPVLTNLTGLQNLDSIGGNLGIYGNSALTSLSGLANEISIGGAMIIANNGGMANLSGLENLISITGGLKIQESPSLIDLTGLDNLASFTGVLEIMNNDALTSLSGLGNLTSLDGGLTISGNDALTNLLGLGNLNLIDGDLIISGNDALNELSGLDNLNSVGEGLYIGSNVIGGGNPTLTDLSGLISLNSLGGLYIDQNPALLSLTGLDSLSSIDGSLEIRWNTLLYNISGLSNINPGSISNLKLTQNPSLSDCVVESLCSYLANPNGVVNIYSNAPGCNSPEEVMDSCLISSVNEIKLDKLFTISPNPLESTTLIEYTLKNNSPITIKILDLSGREMAMLVNELQQQGEQKVAFNTAGLPAGVYFCVLKTNDGTQTRKMIKLN